MACDKTKDPNCNNGTSLPDMPFWAIILLAVIGLILLLIGGVFGKFLWLKSY